MSLSINPNAIKWFKTALPKSITMEMIINWLIKSRELGWEEWQNEIDELHNYRQLEIYIFYSQIVAITMYVIYCKFMYNIMLYGKKIIHKNDPFFRILSNTNSDTLEK